MYNTSGYFACRSQKILLYMRGVLHLQLNLQSEDEEHTYLLSLSCAYFLHTVYCQKLLPQNLGINSRKKKSFNSRKKTWACLHSDFQ
jgi:hypothetical protein